MKSQPAVQLPHARLFVPIAISSGFVFISWLIFPAYRGLISNITQIILALGAGIMNLTTARRRRHPFVWFLIGFGILSWLTGQIIWTATGSPAVSFADIPFIGGLACIALGLFLRPLPNRRRYEYIANTLELFIAGLSLLAIVSFAIFGPFFAADPSLNLEKIVQLAYPVCDLAILIAALRIASRQQSFHAGSPWQYLIAAAGFFAFTDLLYAYLSYHDAYITGSFIDFGWMIGLLLYGLAAYLARFPDLSADPASAKRSGWVMTLPFIPVVLLTALLSYNTFVYDALNPVELAAHRQLVVFALLIIIIGFIRQTITIYENRRLNQQLQQRAQLLVEQNEILDHARMEAEAANDAKNAFLATMSHELRTPLSVVIGTIQYIQFDLVHKHSDPEVRELLGRAEEASKQLVDMINNILDYSKAASEPLTLNNELIQLNEFLHPIYEGFLVLAEKQGIELHFDPDPDMPDIITSDSSRLRQVVMNLLSNAIKFTHEGSVTLRTHKIDNDHFILQVADTGIGIPADKLDTVWQAFTQADTSSTRKYGGTGLGLAIVKQIVLAMGGSTHTASTQDVGTVITLTFPLNRAEGATPEASTLDNRTALTA